MHDARVKLKDGRVIVETFWGFTGDTVQFPQATRIPFALVLAGDRAPIPLRDIESAILIGGRRTAATVGEDEDLLERARRMGWDGN